MKNVEELEENLRALAEGGRIPCSKALQLAEKLKVPPRMIGEAADRLGLKISGCQLGCFK